MPIIFQENSVSLLSDTIQTLVIQDHTLEAYGDASSINGAIDAVFTVDQNKKTWIYTVPTWEYVVLGKGQHVHLEGPLEYAEDGATYVCLRVNNAGGAQAFLTRQISTKAQLAHAAPAAPISKEMKFVAPASKEMKFVAPASKELKNA